jgi:hypothetical protein
MNKFIESYVKKTYGFDVNTASAEELSKVVEIIVSDQTMSHDHGEWDFSAFPNLKKIDCSYNPIDLLNVSANKELEYLRFEGARGNIPHKLDFSGNPHLKCVRAGQDGVVELDFSNNPELEDLSVFLSSSFRWLDVSKCPNLKRINTMGANLPFVDLTNCHKLEKVNINYWNLYKNCCNEFGKGFPRPFVFVDDNFDESVIDEETRSCSYYTYYLIRVVAGSAEERFLKKVLSMKNDIVNIPGDYYGRGVAKMHYELLDLYKALKSE